MEKVKVLFQANWMKVNIGDVTLYAKAGPSYIGMFLAEFGQSNPDFKKAVFPILRNEIIRQAKEKNIDRLAAVHS